MRIKTLQQNKWHYYLQKLESTIQQYLWKPNKALSEEENLPWSGMDFCNVIRNDE